MANTDHPQTRPSAVALPTWLRGRQALVVLAAPAIFAGLALNWSWLTAVGIAPILLSLAPCALMCGLGLCMKGGAGKLCSSGTTAAAENPTIESRQS